MLNSLNTEALTKILLMQNMLSQLPNRKAVFEFVARGVSYLPGVKHADFTEVTEEPAADDASVYPVCVNKTCFGYLLLYRDSSNSFDLYHPYISNLCFMMGAVLQQLLRNEIERNRQAELERRVDERTRQLAKQVEETQAAVEQIHSEKARADRYLEVSEAIFLELDVEGNIVVINRRGAMLLGWSPAEMIGKNWFQIAIPPQNRESMAKLFNAFVHTGGSAEYYENELVCGDGGRRFVSWHNVLLKDESGKIYRLLSSGVDITERKRVEIDLAAEKELLAVTLRSIADGVIATDNDNIILSLNRAAEAFTGWSEKDAVGKPLDVVYQLRPMGQKGEQVWDHGPYQWELTSKEGKILTVSHLKSPIHDLNSRKLGWVVVFKDMTRQNLFRENMERVARLETVGVLAGGIAHDFNNLLSGMFGYWEMASESRDIDEIHLFLKKVTSVYDRARHLTSQLLTFAKGGAPLLREDDLSQVVKDAARFALAGAAVQCRFDIPDDIWPVAFDRNQIAQVVDNLVINAKQAMGHSGTISISLENVTLTPSESMALPSGQYVRVCVCDTGGGIPHELITRIFDPFFTTKQDGTGLGLSTSYSIMQKHNGTIDVVSKSAEGSEFYLYLPVHRSFRNNSLAADSAIHRGKGIIMVLDDELFLRDITEGMLKSMGYEPICFKDGVAVLNYLEQIDEENKTRIVSGLFDLTIPGGKGGAEIVDRVKQLVDEVTLFAVSGYSAGDVMSNPQAFGFADALPKPFRKAELSRLLERHLG